MSRRRHRLLAQVVAALLLALPLALRAEEGDEAVSTAPVEDEAPLSMPESPLGDVDVAFEPDEQVAEAARALAEETEPAEYALPGPAGAGKSGATPQAIPLPSGEGSIQGMGESFAPDLSTGAATMSVPIALPPGRAGVAPTLALSYSSTAGSSEVGYGWSLPVPFIARQSDRGMPRYVDGPAWHAEEDRFFYNGGQELVPVANETAAAVDCDGVANCDVRVPADLAVWQQYRTRVEGGFVRFFRSPDSDRWVAQSKDGTTFEYGVVFDGPEEVGSALALEDDGAGHVYRWLLTRVSDAHGSTIYYLYDEDGGRRYLSDIYYLSPASCAAEGRACGEPLADYGRRVHLVYEARPDATTSYTSTWKIETALRLRRIEVTAAETPGARTLVRRYHLGYEATRFHSLLSTITVEGRPETTDAFGAKSGDRAVLESSLGNALVGPTLPPMRLGYSGQPVGPIAGFGGVSSTVQTSPSSPDHSVNEDRADLFDVNSDGLPDLIVTDPAEFKTPWGEPGVGVYFNGFGDMTGGSFSDPVVLPVPAGKSAVLTLSNANIAPMDVNGDGRVDLLHMPRLATYGYFGVARDEAGGATPADQGWRWVHFPRQVPEGSTDPRIDLAGDGTHIRVVDVNNDHLVDVVRTTGTSIQTWLNLGWLPGGDGQFGSYRREGGEWLLSPEPIETCLPVVGVPVDFASKEVRLGDMNGDGLQDIVVMRAGRVAYIPGRGEGAWGDGPASCEPGFDGARYVEMATPPMEYSTELDGVFLADVNSDGADDIVQVRFGKVDVWFNRAGQSFTGRVVVSGTPLVPSFDLKVRLVDIDGSGTLDVVFGQAGAWKWLDLMGGQRPRMLVSVTNPLGGETELEYGSSAEDYLADLADGSFSWSHLSGACEDELVPLDSCYRSDSSPVISTVVRSATVRDHLNRVGGVETAVETRYAYHDGYYDGVEQEWRGFGAADAVATGDDASPTSWTRTWFHQGRRPQTAQDRRSDNPDEALKGLPYLVEVFDEAGAYLSSAHTTYTLRTLHLGLGGVASRWVYASATDTLLYGTSDFVPGGATIPVPGVIRPGATEEHTLVARGASYARVRTTVDVVTGSGDVIQQTKHGASAGEAIIEVSTPSVVACAESGWMWRATESHLADEGGGVYGQTTRTYSCAGDELTATASVTQPVLYEFPAPEDIVTARTVDAWGNVLGTCLGGEPCLRRSSVTWEETYAAFPASESILLSRFDGDELVATTTATFDVGLGAVLEAVDPNGETTSYTYDGQGRITSVTPPAGSMGLLPASVIAYQLTTSPTTTPMSRVRTRKLTAPGAVLETVGYVDGQGRVRATLATGPDAMVPWVRAGMTRLTAKGLVRAAYRPAFYAGGEASYSSILAPSETDSTSWTDAFGRVVWVEAADGAPTATEFVSPLCKRTWDANDLRSTSPHAGTPAKECVDGHGRVVEQTLLNRQPGETATETYRLVTTYRADGAVVRVTRSEVGVAGHEVTRTFVYDSIKRRVGTTDPDTDNGAETWRYLFNRAGDLVAVRDPRSCGQDFFYDHAGRVVGETYIGCAEAQVQESPGEVVPAGAIGLGELGAPAAAHVRTWYDTYEGSWAPAPGTLDGYPVAAGGVIGRQTATADRSARNVLAYDHRGQVVWEARQLAVIPAVRSILGVIDQPDAFHTVPDVGDDAGTPVAVVFDETATYTRSWAFDNAGRVTALTLPRDPANPGALVGGTMEYDRRGLPARAKVTISSGGTVVEERVVLASATYGADGLETEAVLGDPPAATTQTHYDVRRRPQTITTTRAATGTTGLAAVTVPFSQLLTWDDASNLTAVHDLRLPEEWPDGHRPQTVLIDHDALYHVTGAAYSYKTEAGSSSVDAATDWRAGDLADSVAVDPMQPTPAPMIGAPPPERVADLQWQYDWLGNMTLWEDDAHAFYEREAGAIGNGADEAGLRPSALYLTSDLRGPASNRGGYVWVNYGVSGNVAAVTVRASCTDRGGKTCGDPGGSISTRLAAIEDTCTCDEGQHFQYRWDEVNRLAEARRFDKDGGSHLWRLAARQRYRYDAANARTVKQTIDAAGVERTALYPYAGDFERRGMARDDGAYSALPDVECQYLVAGARVVWQPGDPAAGLDAGHRIVLPISDLLGTSRAAVDLRTGELVEHSTYYPNGARETFIGSDTPIAAEPRGFTEKEADDAVGLVYFGERYLMPRLGRWANPDPLAIHALGGGEVMNSYHYVGGSLLDTHDPLGLDEYFNRARPQLQLRVERRNSSLLVYGHMLFPNSTGRYERGERLITQYSGADAVDCFDTSPSEYNWKDPVVAGRTIIHFVPTRLTLESAPQIFAKAKGVWCGDVIRLFHGTNRDGRDSIEAVGIKVNWTNSPEDDFGPGFYMSEEHGAAVSAAERKEGEAAIGFVDVRLSDLGSVVDISVGGKEREKWDAFLASRDPVTHTRWGDRYQWARKATVDAFLDEYGLKADAILGEIQGGPVAGQTQVMIRSQAVADRLRLKWEGKQ